MQVLLEDYLPIFVFHPKETVFPLDPIGYIEDSYDKNTKTFGPSMLEIAGFSHVPVGTYTWMSKKLYLGYYLFFAGGSKNIVLEIDPDGSCQRVWTAMGWTPYQAFEKVAKRPIVYVSKTSHNMYANYDKLYLWSMDRTEKSEKKLDSRCVSLTGQPAELFELPDLSDYTQRAFELDYLVILMLIVMIILTGITYRLFRILSVDENDSRLLSTESS